MWRAYARRRNFCEVVFRVFVLNTIGAAWQFRTTCGACRGLRLRSPIHSARGQRCGETAKDVPAIFLQGIGSVGGRPKSSTGTNVASLRGTLFARRALRCAAFTASLLESFSGNLEGERPSYRIIGNSVHHAFRLIASSHMP